MTKTLKKPALYSNDQLEYYYKVIYPVVRLAHYDIKPEDANTF